MAKQAFIIRHPAATVSMVFVITVAAAVLATRVTFQSAIEVWFLQDDVAIQTYNEFTRLFAADESVVIGLTSDALFNQKMFDSIERIVAAASMAPHVHRVRSLLDFDLSADVEPGEQPLAPTDWSALRRRARENSLVVPSFLSTNGHTALIHVELARSGNTVQGKRALVTALDKLIGDEAARTGFRFDMTGTPVLDFRALVHNDHDLAGVYPLIAPLLVLLIWLIYGSVRLALIPLAVAITAALWAFGLMGLFGLHTTLLSSAMVPLFLAVGVADSIHVLAEQHRQRQAGKTAAEAVTAALQRLWRPCVFTSLTTAAGLASLISSPLRPLREFGLVAALGVLAALILTFTLVPALLQLIGRTGPRIGIPDKPTMAQQLLTRTSVAIAHLPRRVSRMVIPASLGIASLAALSASQIEIGVDPMSWFKEADAFRVSTERIDRIVGGGTSIEFLVYAPGGSLRNLATLQQLDEFERWLEQHTLVTTCLSMVDILKEVTRASSEGEQRVPRLPRPPALTAGMLDELQRLGELERWSTPDFARGRISCRVPLSRSPDLGGQLRILEQEIKRRFANLPLSVEPTGYATLMVRMEHQLVQSQIRSLSIAFAAVLAMLALLVRSLRIAMLAMAPNILPVIIGLGLMPLIGIGLNPGSVMVAAVALGIVVDDTAHLIVATRRYLDQGATPPLAVADAIVEVGSPVIITSLALITAMSVLTLGSFAPSIHFGVIAITIISAALLTDLLLLPRILMLWYGRAAMNLQEHES